MLRELTGRRRRRFYLAEGIYAAVYGDDGVNHDRDEELEEVTVAADRSIEA